MLPFLATRGVFSANHEDSGQSFKSIITKFAQNMFLPLRKKKVKMFNFLARRGVFLSQSQRFWPKF